MDEISYLMVRKRDVVMYPIFSCLLLHLLTHWKEYECGGNVNAFILGLLIEFIIRRVLLHLKYIIELK